MGVFDKKKNMGIFSGHPSRPRPKRPKPFSKGRGCKKWSNPKGLFCFLKLGFWVKGRGVQVKLL